MREAVFRWQIDQNRKYGETCFLTLRGRSPSATAAFVTGHFKDCPFVKPLADSQARAIHPAMLSHTKTINGFVDARTGRPALSFWIDAVEWASDARAEVDGGGAAAISSGNDGAFSVAWNGHRWNVTGYKMRAIF